MKKSDFVRLVNVTFSPNNLSDGTSGYVYKTRYNLYNYDFWYEWMIRDYYAACGAKIVSTNNNWFDDRFYVYHTKPTKYISPEEFFDNYHKYKRFYAWRYRWVILLSLLLGTVLLLNWMIQNNAAN